MGKVTANLEKCRSRDLSLISHVYLKCFFQMLSTRTDVSKELTPNKKLAAKKLR